MVLNPPTTTAAKLLYQGSRGDDVPVKQVAFTEQGNNSARPEKSPNTAKERRRPLGLLVRKLMASSRRGRQLPSRLALVGPSSTLLWEESG